MAAPIEVELATERGVQITAPQQWLQLLARLGVDNVRIRIAIPGDEPKLSNNGTDGEPRHHVVGLLTAKNELRLPGGTFRANDRDKLAAYFKKLGAEGSQGVTAPRGRFGLTEQQFVAVHADLTQSVDFPTKGQSLRTVLDRLQSKLALKITPTAATEQVIRSAAPIADEVSGLSAGTGLAIVLRGYGLALIPEKPLGQPLVHRIAVTAVDKTHEDTNSQLDAWPIGTESESSPAKLAPVLMETLNVEIDGYTLAEAVNAIAPRIKLAIYWDHAMLATHKIDPAAVKVKLPRTRTYYKRVLDRVLAQGRLALQLRVDESGTPFLWITK